MNKGKFLVLSAYGRIISKITARVVPMTINGIRLPHGVFTLSEMEPKIGNKNNVTFKVETNRGDKRFPATSIEISREVAKRILPKIDNLKVLRKLNKDINIQYLSGIEDNKKKEEVIKYCKELKIDADVYYDNVTKEFIDTCHKNNIKVNVWTVDSKEDAERLINMGVDYITSNILE